MNQSTKNYKRFAVCFAGIFGILSLIGFAFLFLLWLYDPFMLFHKPYFRATTYHSDMRLQAKGIIDNVDFDSAILGTSILENTSAKEASEKLGDKWVNLSIGAGRFEERAIILKYLLRHKQIKSIIYSIDSFTLVNIQNIVIRPELYKDDFVALYKFYFDKKWIRCARKWSKKPECVGGSKDLENLTRWYRYVQNEYKGGFNAWLTFRKNDALTALKIYEKGEMLPPLDYEKMQNYVKKYVFEIIAKNPQIDFYLIVPPLSRFFWRIPSEHLYHQNRTGKQFFTEYKIMLQWFVKESAKYKNVKIYGFDNTAYPDTITNYRDGTHYNADMNSMQLDAIANGTHILTPQNIDKYLSTMESKIKNYDIAPLIAEIKAWEANRNEK